MQTIEDGSYFSEKNTIIAKKYALISVVLS